MHNRKRNQPVLPARLVDRPALVAALDAAVTHKIVTVVAGPGWGKTTSVAAWAARRRACWLSLGDADLSVERLSTGVLRAVRQRLPGLPTELVTTTAHGEGEDGAARAEAIVDLICGLLDAHLDEPMVLVLDDVGMLSPGSEGARLIEGICVRSPESLHLVLLTRNELPFPAAGVGPVREIDSRDLAFTRPEVAALVGPGRDPGLADSVWTRTGGWPAAVLLYLEALSSGFDLPLERLGGSGSQVLADMAATVLSGEPEPTRSLLRTIAVLGRVDLGLCVELGYADAGELLPELARRGLLGTENGDRPTWSAPEPIRELLTADVADVSAIRHRAAVYFEKVGAHAAALRHLVAAERWDDVAQLLLRRDEQLIATGDIAAVLAAVEQLFADDIGDRQLYLVWGYARQQRGDWLGALSCYRQVVGDGSVHACLAWRMGQLYDLTGQTDKAVELFERTTFGDESTLDETRLLSLAVRWFRERGDQPRAAALAARSAAAAARCGGHTAQAWSHLAYGLLAAHDGDRVASETAYGQALEHARRAGHRQLELTIRAERAWFMAEGAAPAEALHEIDEVMSLGRQAGLTGYEPYCLSISAMAKAKLGRFDEALADAGQSQDMWNGMGASRDVIWGLVVLGDLHRRRGEPGQAQAFLDEALYLGANNGVAQPQRVLALATLARIRAADDPDAAWLLAVQAVRCAEELQLWRVQAVLARGWVALLAGDREQARADAADARAWAGQRRDRAGLADALQLAALSSADPRAAAALLTEAGALWRAIGDPVGAAAASLALVRMGGLTGSQAAAEADLAGYGVRCDSGMADVLGVGLPRPARLVIRTLGRFQVLRDGVVVPTAQWQSKKARDLLKILIANRGKPVPRARLVELLWPEGGSSDKTGNRLSVLLSTLRAVLAVDTATPEPIVADRDTVALDLSTVDVDVERFLAAADAARLAHRRGDAGAYALLTEAEELRHGEFLAEDPYEDWAIQARDEVNSAHAIVLRALVGLVRDPDQKVEYLLRLLERDRYDEDVHLRLVRTLRDSGRYGEAQRRHEVYLERMREIGVSPVPEQSPASDLRPALRLP